MVSDIRRFMRRTDTLRRVLSSDAQPFNYGLESFDVQLHYSSKPVDPDASVHTFRWTLDGKPHELSVQHRSADVAWELLAKNQGWTK